jgi:hypothetical protein
VEEAPSAVEEAPSAVEEAPSAVEEAPSAVEEAYLAEEDHLAVADLQEEEASPLNSSHKHKLKRNHRQ